MINETLQPIMKTNPLQAGMVCTGIPPVHSPTARLLAVSALAFTLGFSGIHAANIVFVSDANDPAGTAANTFTGFFPAGSGYTDSGFVTLLQNAGHSVMRFNQPNAQATLLTADQLTELNSYDLIIMSRAVNSGALQTGQGNQWNTAIFKPLIDLSAFHARQSRLGWFTANEAPDATPLILSAVLSGNPVTDAVVDYLFGGVVMTGTNTASTIDEPLDRNSTPVLGVPVAGGAVYARTTYVQENSGATPTINTGTMIAGFPSNTAVRGGVDLLSGYRMFFSAGSRESATAPNSIPLYTGRETLTPTGENIFLRAVEVALNNGVAPASDPAEPVGFTSHPVSATILQNGSVTFSVSVTGAAPRTVQWQRDAGDGVTFTNIPDAVTPFAKSSYTLPVVTLADNNARFRAVAANLLIVTATSEEAILTVTPDTAGPTVLSVSSLDGLTIGVCFDEPVDKDSAEFSFSYEVNANNGPYMTSWTLRPDGRSVAITLDGPLGPTFTMVIADVLDKAGNVMAGPVSLTGTNHGLTSVNVGNVNPTGSSFACFANSFELTGGGIDLRSTNDQFRFVYKLVEGDFDARVQVTSFIGTPDHLESAAKAVLTARASTDTNSAAVNVIMTPPTPGDDFGLSNYRATTGGATNNLGATFIPGGLPGAWMRIKRAGDTFTTYRSTDGMSWVEYGNASLPFGASMVVGVGVASHRDGRSVTGTFSDFRITQTAASPTLINSSFAAGVFSASFQTQNGFTYSVEYKDDLNVEPWLPLPPAITGDGTVQTFTDPGPANTQRFYRVTIP
jgi:hypothetical protein